MKSSCIPHPANEQLVIIRQWQLEFCEDNTAAAALLSYFEYWHNIKLAMRQQNKKLIRVAGDHGEEIEVDISLYQWHTSEDLAAGIMGIIKGKNTINDGLAVLVSKGVISVHNNPNPRFKFDRTRYFLFYPETCIEFLKTYRGVQLDAREVQTDKPIVQIDQTITETPTETPTEREYISPPGKTNGAKPTKEPLADILEYANKGVSEDTAPNPQDQYWQRRDPALRVAQVNLGQFNQVEKSDILALVAMPDFEPPRWELAVMDTARHYKGQGKVARAIEMYHAGGSYEAWRRKTYEQETPIKPTEKLSFGAV